MSTESELEAIPMGPPWSIDVIADLHAGLYSDDVAAQLRLRIAQDVQAAAMLSALDATVDDLSLLPSPRMPERFALRLDAAIAAESAARTAAQRPASAAQEQPPVASQPPVVSQHGAPGQPGFRPPAGPPPSDRSVPAQFRPLTAVPSPASAPTDPVSPGADNVVSLDAARTRRRRWATGIGVAAAVAIAATITVSSLGSSKPAPTNAAGAAPAPAVTSTAAPGISPNALELVPGKFQDAYREINGAKSGPLANPIAYPACMSANNLDQADILGVTQVTFQGAQASAIAVKVDATHARILVVSLKCGIDGGADVLASQVVTR